MRSGGEAVGRECSLLVPAELFLNAFPDDKAPTYITVTSDDKGLSCRRLRAPGRQETSGKSHLGAQDPFFRKHLEGGGSLEPLRGLFTQPLTEAVPGTLPPGRSDRRADN